jgi:hypothetical protein
MIRARERLRYATAGDRPRFLLQAVIPRSTKQYFVALGAEFGVGGRTFASSPIVVWAWRAHCRASRRVPTMDTGA